MRLNIFEDVFRVLWVTSLQDFVERPCNKSTHGCRARHLIQRDGVKPADSTPSLIEPPVSLVYLAPL